jgi:PKD repeat protein
MRRFLFPFVLFAAIQSQAQLHDNMWMVSDHIDSLVFLDFRPHQIEIIRKPNDVGYYGSHSTFCNEEGGLQYFTNCMHIYGKDANIIENGDSINVGYYFAEGAIRGWHGAFFLPDPGDSTRCYLICMFPEKYPGVYPIPIEVRYSLIDNTANNGMGKVLEKDMPILAGGLELNFDHACATRHANGRDWWILVPNRMAPIYYRILLSPEGFSQPELQEIGLMPSTDNPNHYLSFGSFSPNGERFAECEFRTGIIQHFYFDRCTGLLSNPDTISAKGTLIDTTEVYYDMGVAFSASSQLLYFNFLTAQDGNKTYQFDLETADIGSVLDTIFSCDTGSTYVCGTFHLARAPNNKIYIGALVDTNSYNVIHRPNEYGIDCDFEHGGLELPLSLPNSPMAYYPNYRLGPIDGSPCDTLGINNLPVAAFLWDSVEMEVTFTNNSYYEPTAFLWDFGDGATSSVTDPVHNYAAPGTYYACLTASNAYGTDTACQWVTVDSLVDSVSLAVSLPMQQGGISVVPNPASGKVRVVMAHPLLAAATWRLHGPLGREVAGAALPAGQQQAVVQVANVPPGLYFWSVESEGTQVGSGKLVISK